MSDDAVVLEPEEEETIRAIGAVIRSIRKEQGLSLRDVAERTGFSVSFLSLVERGKSSLALTSVYKLARALGVDVATFFAAAPEPEPLPHVTRAAGRSDELVIEGSDHTYRLLSGRSAEREMEPLLVTLDPSDPVPEPVSHDGDEFVYVLSGTIRFMIGGREYDLFAGDSVYFRASIEHSHKIDPQSGPVTALWVLSAPLTSSGGTR
ncbi:MAG: cupin domain-containing protein [Mycolicibacterium hassiacum]|uniref:helix-turn-helix domain-containing protein n=1 Tax=Mycolicibacterium hassiacum TaxID=46351 RepID=UPI0023FA4160|nr:cupin domain-containing protein [Mycolicibacterium hassiacum]MBX5485427.1 cupin domain-containing protein [Mycolicibacterium hassiacum]